MNGLCILSEALCSAGGLRMGSENLLANSPPRVSLVPTHNENLLTSSSDIRRDDISGSLE